MQCLGPVGDIGDCPGLKGPGQEAATGTQRQRAVRRGRLTGAVTQPGPPEAQAQQSSQGRAGQEESGSEEVSSTSPHNAHL